MGWQCKSAVSTWPQHTHHESRCVPRLASRSLPLPAPQHHQPNFNIFLILVPTSKVCEKLVVEIQKITNTIMLRLLPAQASPLLSASSNSTSWCCNHLNLHAEFSSPRQAPPPPKAKAAPTLSSPIRLPPHDPPFLFCSSDSTAAESVMSFAIVAILTMSAPESHMAAARSCSSAALGVALKLWLLRMIFVAMGTSPAPGMLCCVVFRKGGSR